MSITGHVSRAMLSRYSHVRMEAKRRALDEIAVRQNAADKDREKGSRAVAVSVAPQPRSFSSPKGRSLADLRLGAWASPLVLSRRYSGDAALVALTPTRRLFRASFRRGFSLLGWRRLARCPM
jgi:hypothetical protein